MSLRLVFNPVSNNFDYVDNGGSYWQSPVADKTTLDAIITDINGSIRVILDTNDAYRWNSGSSAWQFVGKVKAGTIGSTPNANGFSVATDNTVTLQPASASFGGIVTTGTQSLAGTKTFTGNINVDGALDVTATVGTDTLNLGTANANVINIGHSGVTVNIQGDTLFQDVTNLQVTDKLFTVNKGGSAASATASGMEVEEDSVSTGYIKTSGDRNSWIVKAPNTAGDATITPGAGGITLNQSSHNPVTLGAVGSSPNSNGATLSTQAINLEPADSTNPGVITAGAQSLGGVKTLTDTTQSTSKDTGALILEGGLGVEKNAYVGGILNVTSTASIDGAITNAALTASQAVVTDGSKNLVSMAYSATGSTSNLVSRDADGNSVANNWMSRLTNVTSAAGTTVLTSASNFAHQLTGTQNQTFQLPDATTLIRGTSFEFDNNSTGTLTIVDFASGPVVVCPAGGRVKVYTTNVGSSAGVWDSHFYMPTNSSYGTAGMTITGTLNVTGAITGTTSGNLLKSTGDIDQTSFSAIESQTSANVTGLAFANGSVRSAEVLYSIYVNATSPLYQKGTLQLIQRAADWVLVDSFVGDDALITFDINSSGQVRYTSPTYSGFVSATIKFRALTSSV